MQKYIIGIDSGTTSLKAVVMDILGNEIYKKDFKLKAICPRQDMYEEDMNEIWDCARRALRDVGERFCPDSIIGIGITAQGDGLWMIDEKGNPVRNGCCFCDGRASEIVDEWVADGTCKKLFDLTGTRVFTGNQNAIVKWMERYESKTLGNAKYFLHLKDYLFFKLTGRITTDATDQSLIYLNMHTRDYDKTAFELCGLHKYRDRYPPVLSAKENVFCIQSSVAAELGLNKKIVVTSGPMDVSACALGSGVIEPGHCCSIIGTAALHEMVIDRPLADTLDAGMTVAHVMQNRWLRLMASLAGTPNLEWVLNTVGAELKQQASKKSTSVYTLIEEMVKSVPIGSRGVMYHPYLLAGGERAPFTDANARASFTNINITHGVADILRATYEGVAFAMLDCYCHMPQEVKRITVCGGGAKSAFWCGMFADVLGKEIIAVKGDEIGAKGAVLNNAVVQGVYPDYATAVAKTVLVQCRYMPNDEHHQQYVKLYPLYQDTYEALRPLWKLRHQLQEEDKACFIKQ